MNVTNLFHVTLAAFSGIGVWLVQLIWSIWRKKRVKFDVFISYPMKGLVKIEEQAKLADAVVKIKQQLEQNYHGISVFSSVDDKMEDGKRLLDQTRSFDALKATRCFVLIYPESVSSSSVLLEAGCAIALDKISIFISKNNRNLPYLIRAHAPYRKNIMLFEYKNIDELPDYTSQILTNIEYFSKKRQGAFALEPKI